MLGEDEVVGDVPDAAGDGGIGEDEAEFVDVALDLAAVLLVTALTAFVVDDEHGAVWAAHDTVGAQVLDSVVVPQRCGGHGDGALTIDFVSRVKPSGDTASLVHDGTANMGVEAIDVARIVGVVGDDSMLDRLGDNTVQITAVTNAAEY